MLPEHEDFKVKKHSSGGLKYVDLFTAGMDSSEIWGTVGHAA